VYHVHRWYKPEPGGAQWDLRTIRESKMRKICCNFNWRTSGPRLQPTAVTSLRGSTGRLSRPVKGDPIIRAAIRDWRDRSLKCIKKGFKSLVVLIRESQLDAGSTPADMAKMLTWEAIDQAFFWTTEDKSNSTRFKEWESRVKLELATVDGLQIMVSPECILQNVPLVDQFSCDFKIRFKQCVDELWRKALLDVPAAQSTNLPTERTSKPHPEMLTFRKLRGGSVAARKPFSKVALLNTRNKLVPFLEQVRTVVRKEKTISAQNLAKKFAKTALAKAADPARWKEWRERFADDMTVKNAVLVLLEDTTALKRSTLKTMLSKAKIGKK